LKILVIVGAVLLVLLGTTAALAAVGFGASQSVQSEARTTLHEVGQDTVDLDRQLNGVKTPDLSSFNSSNPDFTAAKQSIDGYASRLGTARQALAGDRNRLRTAGAHLTAQSRSPLTLPFRAGITDQQSRVANATSALDAADSLLGIGVNQYQALSALMDGLGAIYAVETKLGQQDVSGALALLPSAAAKLGAAQQAAQGPNLPPQLGAVVTATQKLATDFEAFLQAVQRGDAAAEARLVTSLDDDARALQSFDTAAIDSYEQSLAQPYIDRYERGMKAAGFTLSG
jgi:hypothetical protein